MFSSCDSPPANRAHQTPSVVWQRRTNKVVASAVVIIGLTMMISTIPQCIYVGLAFVIGSLCWLAWMTMQDKRMTPEMERAARRAATSPVLFLVTSHFSQGQRYPTPCLPNDKPPTYEQILKLDGLPPDYQAIICEKPPRYEEVNFSTWTNEGSTQPASGPSSLPLTLEVPNLTNDVTTLPYTNDVTSLPYTPPLWTHQSSGDILQTPLNDSIPATNDGADILEHRIDIDSPVSSLFTKPDQNVT